MKIFKSTILAAIALTSGFGLASCDGNDDAPEYTPGADAQGVYFPATDSENVPVEAKSTEFTVEVARANGGEAATYNLACASTDEDGYISFPSSVSFAQGEKKTNIVVTLDPAKAIAGASYDCTIEITGVEAFNYGKTIYNFTLEVAQAWGPWEKAGTGECDWYADLGFGGYSGVDPGLPISVRKNIDDPNQWQFHIEHWFRDVDLFINYNAATHYVTIPVQNTGQTINSEYALYVADAYTYSQIPDSDIAFNEDYASYSFYNPETGYFDIYVIYFSVDETGAFRWNGSFGYEGCQIGGFPDFSVNMDYSGKFTNPAEQNFAVINATIGADATETRFYASTTMTGDQMIEAILANAEGVVSTTETGNVEVRLPLNGGGYYTAVAVTFDGETPQKQSMVQFNISESAAAAGSWEDYSVGMIFDAWFTARYKFGEDGAYTYEDLPWEITIQKDTENEGVYRMVSPYTVPEATVVMAELNTNVAPMNVVIDASNPECVKIEPQLSGFQNEEYGLGSGILYMANGPGVYSANYGASDDAIIAEGANDVYEDGMVYVAEPLFGPSAQDCEYSWNSKPTGLIVIDEEASAAPSLRKLAKINDYMNECRNYNKYGNMLQMPQKFFKASQTGKLNGFTRHL